MYLQFLRYLSCPAETWEISEVFTAVTMKNGVFWDATLCASYKNWRFEGT
jgi:hypothetical protein